MAQPFVLPNGVTCVCDERPNSGLVTMQVFLNKGSARESADEQGLTNLTQEACFGGTATRSRLQISHETESTGASVGSETSLLSTSFKALCLTKDADNTFAVLSDVIRNPAFAPDEVERTKAQISQGIAAVAQQPQKRAAKDFFETAFSGEGVGRSVEGTPELLASFTPGQIAKKHADMLANPSDIVISFSGDIDEKKAREMAQQYFGDIPRMEKSPAVTATFTGGDKREETDNDQLKLFMGFPAPDGRGADRVTMLLLQNLLAGGMSTPIFQEFREKRGLVYTAGAQYLPFDGDSAFIIVSGSGAGKAGEIAKVTFDILRKAAEEGFDQKARDEASERMLRNLDGAREKAMGAGGINGSQLLEKGRLQSREEFAAKLKAVTNDDLRRVCTDMLKSGKYALSAVGPLDTLPPPEDIRKMMAEAAAGLDAPAKNPAAPLAAAFSAAAAPAAPATPEETKITVLENGLKIVTIERPGPLSCGAWVGVGSDNETPALSGATHMNEHMMFRGTPLYGPGTIDRVVEGELGGQLNAYTSMDKTCYYFYNLAPPALDKVIEICGQMVFHANIAEEEYTGKPGVDKDGKPVKLGAERDAVFEEMRMDNDMVGHRMIDLMSRTAYPDQPHGRPILGTEESLKGISAKDLRAYRDDFYTPNNVIFCAAGPVRHEDVVAAVRAKYGHLEAGSVANLPTPVWAGGTAHEEAESARLCNVLVGAPAVSRTDPDVQAYDALATILGDGGSSTLHRELVDNLQITPEVECGTMTYRNTGTFLVTAVAPAEDVKPMVSAIYRTLRDTIDNLTEADLAKAKAVMESNTRVHLETNQAISNSYACDVQAFGHIVTPEETYAEIRKLTLDDLRRVGAKILAANPVASMIVPTGTDPALLPTHAEVTAMRDGIYALPQPKPQGPGVSPSAP